MNTAVTRGQAVALLRKYNKDAFHLRHALTVEGVMRWYARRLGYEEDEDFWGLCGLLHDVDFEMFPEAHCVKAPELLKEIGAGDELVHAVCSHGYALTVDIEPVHEMEKALYAADELTGLIGATVLMLPSKDIGELQLKSLKKKFKDRRFAAGCSRDVIARGADMLGWDMDRLMQDTIDAMRACDASVRAELAAWTEGA